MFSERSSSENRIAGYAQRLWSRLWTSLGKTGQGRTGIDFGPCDQKIRRDGWACDVSRRKKPTPLGCRQERKVT